MQLSYGWRFAHLAALWGYGVSQPIFAMLLANPEFLVINGASRAVAVTSAIVLAFGPPLIALGVEAALGVVSTRAATVAHLLCVALFGFTALLQVLALFDPSRRLALVVPAVLAYVGMVVYARWSPLRTFLSISVVLPVVGLLVFMTAAPLAIADAEGAHVSVGSETPVVLIVFDELPVSSLIRADGEVDGVRYPGFGRLAREGTWYPHTTTVDEFTTRAVPAILTGRIPRGGTLPTLADHPHNLFTLLGESYSFRVREPVTRLCPVTYCPEQRSRTPLPSRVSGLLHDLGINYLHGSLPSDFHGNIAPLREGWGALIENTARGTDEFVGTDPPLEPASHAVLPAHDAASCTVVHAALRAPVRRRVVRLRAFAGLGARRLRAVARRVSRFSSRRAFSATSSR